MLQMSKAITYLQELLEQPLSYGIKSINSELFVFRFGPSLDALQENTTSQICTYNLHVMCGIKIVSKIEKKTIKEYSGNSSYEVFSRDIIQLIGLTVKRVALSEKNDIWIDFGEYWVIIVTNEDDDESWRFFSSDDNRRHLVASDSWIDY